MIVAEQRDGALRKISLELASTARKLADQTGDEVSAILLGSGIEGLAIELGKQGFCGRQCRHGTLHHRSARRRGRQSG
jgi:electron transfer flavoprotein alpha subunit